MRAFLHLAAVWLMIYFAIQEIRSRSDAWAAFAILSALVNAAAAYHIATA